MKMTNLELAESLRMIADFYETHPNCRQPNCGKFGIMEMDIITGKEEMAELMKEFGTCGTRKEDSFFLVQKRFGKMTLSARDWLRNVCTKKIVGTRIVKKQVAKEYEEQEVEEEIVEWECNGSLIPAGEKI